MKTSIISLAIAVVPLITLVSSVIVIKIISSWHGHHSLSYHRTRRNILRALASGVMMR